MQITTSDIFIKIIAILLWRKSHSPPCLLNKRERADFALLYFRSNTKHRYKIILEDIDFKTRKEPFERKLWKEIL